MRLVWALRSLLCVAWMAATMVPCAVAILATSIFVRGARLYELTLVWLRLAVWGARTIGGVRYRVRGLDRLPTAAQSGRAVVLAAKHQSTWEAFALPTLMPHPLAYVFKRELLFVPFFGWAMSRLDMIHIDRRKRGEAWARVAEQGRQLAARGIWVIFFPEGTRTARGSQGSYKSGAARLAIACNVPIVPIAVSSARCWPARSLLMRPGMVEVSIGEPIDSAGRQPEDLMREVEAWIEAEMRRLDPEAYADAAMSATSARQLGRGGA